MKLPPLPAHYTGPEIPITIGTEFPLTFADESEILVCCISIQDEGHTMFIETFMTGDVLEFKFLGETT